MREAVAQSVTSVRDLLHPLVGVCSYFWLEFILSLFVSTLLHFLVVVFFGLFFVSLN